jgi:lipid-A-disaccharide synthase
MIRTPKKLMIVAGEASGDGHAAKLVNALRDAAPRMDLEFFGAAGPRMREAGVEAVVRSDRLSVVGLAEIGKALPMFLRASKDLRDAAKFRNPDAVILVDFPDFNLKLAKSFKKQGFSVIYYISPQLWAWRKYRLSSVKRYIDLMITVLPFEKSWYARHGVDHVEYVGSPLAREVHADVGKSEFFREFDLDAGRPIVALLPGSRHKEIVRILPVMLSAVDQMKANDPRLQFTVAAVNAISSADIRKVIREHPANIGNEVKIVESRTYDLLAAADAAAITSGTATLEAGMIGTPMAIVYKTSGLNYRLLEPIIDVPHYGLINLIAEERVAAELIQDEFTANSLAEELTRLLSSDVNSEMRKKLKTVTDKLGHGGASKRAAELIIGILEDKPETETAA